jgi:hypothetical protein
MTFSFGTYVDTTILCVLELGSREFQLEFELKQ